MRRNFLLALSLLALAACPTPARLDAPVNLVVCTSQGNITMVACGMLHMRHRTIDYVETVEGYRAHPTGDGVACTSLETANHGSCEAAQRAVIRGSGGIPFPLPVVDEFAQPTSHTDPVDM